VKVGVTGRGVLVGVEVGLGVEVRMYVGVGDRVRVGVSVGVLVGEMTMGAGSVGVGAGG